MKVCLECGRRFEGGEWICPGCGHSPELIDGLLSFARDMARENDGFSPEFFEDLAEVELKNFWFRSRNRLLTWALRRYFPDSENFLEVGCGTGFVLSGIRRELPGLELWGSEVRVEGLDFARKRLEGTTLFQMDARKIPFEDEFDVLGAFDVLEHIEEDDAVLREMFRATKPGGGIILTVPQHRFLWSVVDDYSFHKRRYSRKELSAKVEGAGFEVIRVSSFVFFLLPLMLVNRIRRNVREKSFDLMAELRINPALNALFEKALGIERFFMRAGLSFPAGGSLLLVGKKNRR